MYICIILICWQTSVVLFFDLLLVAAETSCDFSILVHYNFFYMVIFTSSRKKEGFCNVSFLLPVNASSTWDPFTSAETVLSRSISPSASGSSVDTAPIHSWYDTHTHGWQRFYYLYIVLCQLLLILTPLSCSGRSFLTGPWPDVHTAEKCKYWNNSWVFPKTVSFFTHHIFSVNLFPALLLVAGTPGGGACCASCCSSSSPPPQQDLWWVSVCVTVYGYLEEFLFFLYTVRC